MQKSPILLLVILILTFQLTIALPEPTIKFTFDSDYSDSKAIIGQPSTANGLIDNSIYRAGTGSVYLNGLYDEIRYNGSSVTNLNNNSIDRTISFWAKIKRLDPNAPNFIRIGNNPVIGAFADDNEMWYGWWDYGGYITGYNLSNNEWRLFTFVITASNNNMKAYFDGTLVADYNESIAPEWGKPLDSYSGDFQEDIDIFGSSLMTFFDKETWVDDVRIYEGTAFNSSQVQELYNSYPEITPPSNHTYIYTENDLAPATTDALGKFLTGFGSIAILLGMMIGIGFIFYGYNYLKKK